MSSEEKQQEVINQSEAKQVSQAEEQPKKKIDIKKLLSIIPPASELRKKEKKLREKRIRIKFDDTLGEGLAKVPKDLASMLNINEDDKIEIVIAGRKKFVFTAKIIDETGTNIVYVYPEELREKGVADNSIATLRKHMG